MVSLLLGILYGGVLFRTEIGLAFADPWRPEREKMTF